MPQFHNVIFYHLIGIDRIQMKIFSAIFVVIFVVFALVQLNDPDPWLWTTLYLFSAYTALSSAKNYYNPMLLMILVVTYGLWAIFIFPYQNISEWIHFEEKAKSLEMKMPFVEEARESLGLLICFTVNLIYLIVGFKKSKLPGYNIEFSQSSGADRKTEN